MKAGDKAIILDGETYHQLPVGATVTIVRIDLTLIYVELDGETAYLKPQHLKRIHPERSTR